MIELIKIFTKSKSGFLFVISKLCFTVTILLFEKEHFNFWRSTEEVNMRHFLQKWFSKGNDFAADIKSRDLLEATPDGVICHTGGESRAIVALKSLRFLKRENNY